MCAIAFLLLIEVRSIVDCVMIFKGRGLKMGVFVGGGGGGGLTWTLILRIFGMVSITFFFAPPSIKTKKKNNRSKQVKEYDPNKQDTGT